MLTTDLLDEAVNSLKTHRRPIKLYRQWELLHRNYFLGIKWKRLGWPEYFVLVMKKVFFAVILNVNIKQELNNHQAL